MILKINKLFVEIFKINKIKFRKDKNNLVIQTIHWLIKKTMD